MGERGKSMLEGEESVLKGGGGGQRPLASDGGRNRELSFALAKICCLQTMIANY